jgi:hypothetical protein
MEVGISVVVHDIYGLACVLGFDVGDTALRREKYASPTGSLAA